MGRQKDRLNFIAIRSPPNACGPSEAWAPALGWEMAKGAGSGDLSTARTPSRHGNMYHETRCSIYVSLIHDPMYQLRIPSRGCTPETYSAGSMSAIASRVAPKLSAESTGPSSTTSAVAGSTAFP